MKTPEVIKNSLRICSTWETNCEECPYKTMKKAISCSAEMKRDSLTYIEQLEKRASLNTLRDAIYEDAVAHGLWEKTDNAVQRFIKEYQRLEMYNLRCVPDQDEVLRKKAVNVIQTEIMELEYSSDNKEAYTEELADVIIASLSVAGKLGIDIDAAVLRKMEINKARPWKHGKENEGEA